MNANEEKWSRDTAQGSVYDHIYFTDDELKQGEEINRQAQAGLITKESAHNWWQNKRAGYGYDGGEDGHGFTKLAEQAKNDTAGYTGRYQSAMDQAANAILNRKAFSYDAESDPMYQQYKDSYTRQGKQAMEDTLAQVSARTGGLASSYAGTAAQQTYDGYMAALADKVPELRQLAYQMYMDEGNTMRQDLQLLQGLDATEYGRYRDGVADSQWQQNFDTQKNQWQQSMDLQREQFDYDKDLAAAQLMGEAGDYSGYQGTFNLTDEQVTSLEEHDAKGDKLTAAQLLAQAGDYSGYKELLNLTDEQVAMLNANSNSGKVLAAAELMAQAGDFSLYKTALGLTDEQVAVLEKKYQEENGLNVTGSSAGGSGGGWNNGKYSEGEVAKLQEWLGMSAMEQDGRYGAKSAAAAKAKGYTSLDAAMDAYRQGNTNDIAMNGLYQRIVGYIENGSKTVAEIATMIEKSALSDTKKKELLTMLGY